jgi:hypothetical protein
VRAYLKELGGRLRFVLVFPLILITPILLPVAIVYTMWRDRSK